MSDELGIACHENASLHPGFVQEIIDDMKAMSGLIVWRVSTTWANNGRVGKTNDVVVAEDAIKAVQAVWEVEDPRDLRTVEVEWLCPAESLKSAGMTRVKLEVVEQLL